ncbi:MAG: hypothetical protein ACLUGD_04130 [Ruminococcus sp.]
MASLSAVVGAEWLCSIRRRLGKCGTYAGNHYCGGAVLGMVSGLIYVTLDSAHHNIFGCNPIYEGVLYTITSGKYVMTEYRILPCRAL